MKKIILAVTVCVALQCPAQKTGQDLVDSLILELPRAADDTIKIRLYNRIFNTLVNTDTKEALKYARLGLTHAQQMKWQKGIAVFRANLGQFYSNAGNYDSSLLYYQTALSAFQAAKDKQNMSNTYNNMGVAAQNIRADFTAATKFYLQALKIAEEIKDSTRMSNGMHNLSAIYLTQQNFTKALEYEQRALAIRESMGNLDEVAGSLETMGKIFFQLNDITRAKEHFEKAAPMFESTGNIAGLASIWSSLSLVYKGDHRRIIETRIKARDAWNEINPLHSTAITNLGNLGIAYIELVKYDTLHKVQYGDVIPDDRALLLQKAGEYLKGAIQLTEQTGESELRSFFIGSLAEVQELTGDYKNAYFNYRSFKETQDSIYSQENKNKIAAAESQIEIDKKNSELKIKQLALDGQRKTLWGLVAGLVLLATIGILLYRQNQARKRNNELLRQLNTELDTANKVKAKFFAILSHDLRAPIARLSNFLHLQKESPDLINEGQAAKHQQKMVDSADALLENMESMLLWSKGQMDHFAPSIKDISVKDLFTYLGQNFAAETSIHFSFTDTDAIVFRTDEHYLKTIMTNLTANAVKALEHTEDPLIEWKAEAADGVVKLMITDNGPGIDPAIFQSTSISGEDSRFGLGIHIIKDLARVIHCTISTVNVRKGSCVILSLPKK
ncbi:tetratricopeptide repeat-containing sensor histidine kinase [Terrimonas sp. NA20]|uniref:histidine kinase n=1 Tax=Terrimonas ginsenosidimutans TaxID=2908004 RepID=A0ABS9KN77_9BACT|nr:tetratricopeptide repeat-containing sensor histidine kinase [Terrimonas ginsenosidimutans]MCG2613782.1 tetratricopeptide repeat-containing sensor histidine kinase [Terrimonas ginsenosidimutans]